MLYLLKVNSLYTITNASERQRLQYIISFRYILTYKTCYEVVIIIDVARTEMHH